MQARLATLLLVLAAFSTDASKVKEKPNIRGRKFPVDVCPAMSTPAKSVNFDPSKYTSGKTPYPIPPENEQVASAKGCPGCTIAHVHLVSRHGTRYPTEGNVYTLIFLEGKLKHANPQNPALAWVKTWQSPLDPVKNGALNDVGWDDLRKLALRDQKRYNPLLNKSPTLASRIDFRATAIQRSQDSGDAYMEAIFGARNPAAPKKKVLPRTQDPEMRPWEMCPKYKLAKGSPKIAEMKKQREGAFMQKLTERIAGVLGMKVAPPKDDTKQPKGAKDAKGPKPPQPKRDPSMLEPKDVSSMYTACMSSVSMCFKQGQFCNLFTEQEMSTLNYFKDMQYYHVHGPGNPINVKMAGPLIAAIRKEMAAAIANPNGGPQFHLRFNHAETVARLANGLHIWGMPKETGNDPNALRQSRDIPFAANIHLELWKGNKPVKLKRRSHSKKKKEEKKQKEAEKKAEKKEKKHEKKELKHAKEHAEKAHKHAVKQCNSKNSAHLTPPPNANMYYVRMLVNERPRVINGCSTMFCPFEEFLCVTEEVASNQLAQACALSPEEQAQVDKNPKKNKKAKDAQDAGNGGPAQPEEIDINQEPTDLEGVPDLFAPENGAPQDQAPPQGPPPPQ